jgi:hypothetical protein
MLEPLSRSLPHDADFERCQACARCSSEPGIILRYREHHADGRPSAVCVSLCLDCAERILDCQPRRYTLLGEASPAPGAMGICRACFHRVGLQCANPEATFNGGRGLVLRIIRERSGGREHVAGVECHGRRVAEERESAGLTAR